MEDKSNIVYEIDCITFKLYYFSESKWALKLRSDEHKRSAIVKSMNLRNTLSKKITTLNLAQKKFVDKESRLIPRNIKDTIHSLMNSKRINKISCILFEIWLPDLREFEVS